MKKKTLWITETAMLIALLVIVQAVTRGASQLVTGSCVNVILALSALTAGISSAAVVAVVSPFFAFLLGIGPQLLPIVPAIALGNGVYVTVLWALARDRKLSGKAVIAWLAASVCKFLALYLVVVQLLCRILPLKEAQVATFSTMFSWPQLVTALIGGAAALIVAPAVRKALGTR